MAKKAKQPPKRKRPASVMQKAWATRRAKKAADMAAAKAILTPDAKERLLKGMASPAEAQAARTLVGNGKLTHRSKATVRSKPGPAKIELYPQFKRSLLDSGKVEGNTVHVNPAPSQLDIQTEEILRLAGSNNREERRPGVKHELANMLNVATLKAYDEAIEDERRRVDERLLCAFVAQFNLIDSPRFAVEFAPHMVSPITLRAMVKLLESLGYTARGKTGKAIGTERSRP